MAKVQIKCIMEHRALRQLGADDNLTKNLDSTREFVQCLGNQMQEELNVSKFHAARKLSKKTKIESKTVYRWLNEDKEI